MAEDSDLERTEEATPRRREQAREEGQVPRSRELATFTVTMTGVAMLVAYGGVLYQQLKELFARTLTFTDPITGQERVFESPRRLSLDIVDTLSD